MRVCVCMCVCVFVPTPEAIKDYSHEIKPEQPITNQTSPTALQFAYMALAIDITDGHGLNNEAHHYLMLKKSCICRSFLSKRPFTSCTLLTILSASVLKVGIAKLTKTDCLVVLQ